MEGMLDTSPTLHNELLLNLPVVDPRTQCAKSWSRISAFSTAKLLKSVSLASIVLPRPPPEKRRSRG